MGLGNVLQHLHSEILIKLLINPQPLKIVKKISPDLESVEN
jgi:hypothetical protein